MKEPNQKRREERMTLIVELKKTMIKHKLQKIIMRKERNVGVTKRTNKAIKMKLLDKNYCTDYLDSLIKMLSVSLQLVILIKLLFLSLERRVMNFGNS